MTGGCDIASETVIVGGEDIDLVTALGQDGRHFTACLGRSAVAGGHGGDDMKNPHQRRPVLIKKRPMGLQFGVFRIVVPPDPLTGQILEGSMPTRSLIHLVPIKLMRPTNALIDQSVAGRKRFNA